MKKYVYRWLLPVVVCILIQIVVFMVLRGIPVLGIPDWEDVEYVEITHSLLHPQPKAFSEEQYLENAVNVAKFLSYSLKKADEEEPLIIITYYLKNGRTMTIAAGENTVYWKGKARKIHGDNGETFRNVAEALFFMDDIMENGVAPQPGGEGYQPDSGV